jgi:hypothetical protein
MSESKNPQPSIVAEAVATYGRTTPAYGVPSTIKPYKIAGIETSDAVWEFARKHNFFPYLEMGIQWIREFFPTARDITLKYVVDPEVDNFSSIDIVFYVSGTVEEIYEQYQRLNRERMRYLPFEQAEKIGFIFGWT